MGAKIGVLLNCGQQSQFSKVRREFDAGRVNLDPPMTCADWPVPGNLTLLHPQTAYTRKPLHRYVCNRWHNTSSVTGILSQLEWVPLATRRANTRLCMMYRVAHTPVGEPWTPWLTFAHRTTRGSHAWKYISISTSHDARNQLPSIIIDATSLDAFRSRLITSQP